MFLRGLCGLYFAISAVKRFAAAKNTDAKNKIGPNASEAQTSTLAAYSENLATKPPPDPALFAYW